MKNKSSLFILGLTILGVGVWLQQVRVSTGSETLLALPRIPASSPPTEKKSDPTQKKSALSEIKDLEVCYQSNSCDFPQTDPRSYGIALGHKIADRTKDLYKQLKNNPLSQKELAELARLTMKIDDGFVQSAALDIFKDLPVSEENLLALSEGLQNNTDPLIAEKAIVELQRYMGTPNESKAQQTVQTMLQGAHFSSQKVGENILVFINEQSFNSYQQIQQQLPSQSRVARDLQTALSEYRRQRSGG